MELPEHARRNRDVWTVTNAEYTDARARESWSQEEIAWGAFGARETEIVAVEWAKRWAAEALWSARRRA